MNREIYLLILKNFLPFFFPHNYLTSPDEIFMFDDFIKNLYFLTHRFQGCAHREPVTGGTVRHDS